MKSIIISTQQTAHHEWLAFSSWYSIHRNAPDVKVGLIFPRGERTFQFNWTRKCDVPIASYRDDPSEAVKLLPLHVSLAATIIPDTVMLIRSDLTLGENIPPATSEEPAALVDITQVGKFNVWEWIEKEKGHPFYRTAQFGQNKTVNEGRVVALWRQMGGTFDFINRP